MSAVTRGAALRGHDPTEEGGRVRFSDQPDPSVIPRISLKMSEPDWEELGRPLVVFVTVEAP